MNTLQKATVLGAKLRALADALEMPEYPCLPPKVGHVWELKYTWGERGYRWEEVPDSNANGTEDNPIVWSPFMEICEGYFYNFDGVRYVCIKTGTPEEITEEFFVEY